MMIEFNALSSDVTLATSVGIVIEDVRKSDKKGSNERRRKDFFIVIIWCEVEKKRFRLLSVRKRKREGEDDII